MVTEIKTRKAILKLIAVKTKRYCQISLIYKVFI